MTAVMALTVSATNAETPAQSQSRQASAQHAVLTVLTPPIGEKSYHIAGQEFARLWKAVTGQTSTLLQAAPDLRQLPDGKVVVIGSDSVQPVVHELIRSNTLQTLGIAYGTDAYCMRSVPLAGGQCLILAGGCGRSTLYAVYDFFRRQAGAEYFWDGDVIPRHATIELSNLDIRESPHFEYRGLRYFAHRGLHRFQAEHWDLEDWQREIDWLVKKRFNLFMLRTGIDDLFQRAFPGDVPYPPVDGPDPDAQPRSYNDRTSFWPLKYRGELRKAVLAYARDRGLVHPEDVGTITHWYSHTPGSFYRSHPGFPVITDQTQGYRLSTQAIWDIEDQRSWDAYWRLSQTHLREFGAPRMFHTIGMAERVFGKDDRDNLQRKLYVYRRTQQMLREHYPDAPLLIASWDFIGWKWTDADVRGLLDEFDPQRTLVLDYTADAAHKATYRDWGLIGRFPWIFGIFHGFARNSDVHEDYSILEPRLREAAADPLCRGLVLWSEISHNDTFLLEYLADNSWQPQRLELAPAIARYCRARYRPDLADAMVPVWSDFQETAQTLHWAHGSNDTRPASFALPQYRMSTGGGLTNLTSERLAVLQTECARIRPKLLAAPDVLRRLADLSSRWYEDPLWRRDALDMGRTIADRALFVALVQQAVAMEEWREQRAEDDKIQQLARVRHRLLEVLGELLGQSDDFSMAASLQRLRRAEELGGVVPVVNPHSETTLKGNAENDYCRSHQYELVSAVYLPETEAYDDAVLRRIATHDRTAPWRRADDFTARTKEIVDRFYATPLPQLAPTAPREAGTLAKNLLQLASVLAALLPENTDQLPSLLRP